MKISVYTTASNAIEEEFTLFEGVKQALTFADEVIYVDGGSKDGTSQWMEAFAAKDNRIKIFHSPWPDHMQRAAYALQKNIALSKCTGDWCMLMDADEVYSDELAANIKRWIMVAETRGSALYCKTRHFFFNYDCLCDSDPWQGYEWYKGKIYVVKNNIGIHHGNADGDHDGFVDNEDRTVIAGAELYYDAGVNHYGHVRSDEMYSQKKNVIERRYHPDWKDLDYTLAVVGIDKNCFEHYNGIHPQSMQERIKLPIPLQHKDVLAYYKNWLENNWDPTWHIINGGTNV